MTPDRQLTHAVDSRRGAMLSLTFGDGLASASDVAAPLAGAAGPAHLFSDPIAVAGSGYAFEAVVDATDLSIGAVGFYIDEYDGSRAWISGQYKGEIGSGEVVASAFAYTPTSSAVVDASLQVFITAGSSGVAYLDELSMARHDAP